MAPESDANPLLFQIIVCAVVFTVCVIVFSIIHRKRWFEDFYFPRDPGKIRIVRGRLFEWASASWRLTKDDLLRDAGPDATAILIFLKYTTFFFLSLVPVLLSGLLPVHIWAGTSQDSNSIDPGSSNTATNSQSDKNNERLYTISRVPDSSDWFWAHTCVAYYIFGSFYFFILRAYRAAICAKAAYNVRCAHSPRSAIIITNLPPTITASELRKHLESLHLDSIADVTILRACPELQEAIAARWAAINAIESLASDTSSPLAPEVRALARRELTKRIPLPPKLPPASPSLLGLLTPRAIAAAATGILTPRNGSAAVHSEDNVNNNNKCPSYVPVSNTLNAKEVEKIQVLVKALDDADVRIKFMREKYYDEAATVHRAPIIATGSSGNVRQVSASVGNSATASNVESGAKSSIGFTTTTNGVALVTFSNPFSAAMASNAVISTLPDRMNVSLCALPDDLIYASLVTDPAVVRSKRTIATLVTMALVVFSCIIVGLLTQLTAPEELEKLAEKSQFFSSIYKNAFLGSFMQSLLPTLLVTIYFILIPKVFNFCAYISLYVTQSHTKLLVLTRYFYFLIINLVFSVILSRILTALFTSKNPETITYTDTNGDVKTKVVPPPKYESLGDYLSLVASVIPSSTFFHFNYLLLQAFSSLPLSLIQIAGVVLHKIFPPKTPRQKHIRTMRPLWEPIEFTETPTLMNIGLLFSLICPLIIVPTVSFSVISYFVWRYRLAYQVRVSDTQGRLFSRVVNMLHTGLVLFAIVSISILTSKKSFGAIAISPLLLVYIYMRIYFLSLSRTLRTDSLESWREWEDWRQRLLPENQNNNVNGSQQLLKTPEKQSASQDAIVLVDRNAPKIAQYTEVLRDSAFMLVNGIEFENAHARYSDILFAGSLPTIWCPGTDAYEYVAQVLTLTQAPVPPHKECGKRGQTKHSHQSTGQVGASSGVDTMPLRSSSLNLYASCNAGSSVAHQRNLVRQDAQAAEIEGDRGTGGGTATRSNTAPSSKDD